MQSQVKLVLKSFPHSDWISIIVYITRTVIGKLNVNFYWFVMQVRPHR